MQRWNLQTSTGPIIFSLLSFSVSSCFLHHSLHLHKPIVAHLTGSRNLEDGRENFELLLRTAGHVNEANSTFAVFLNFIMSFMSSLLYYIKQCRRFGISQSESQSATKRQLCIIFIPTKNGSFSFLYYNWIKGKTIVNVHLYHGLRYVYTFLKTSPVFPLYRALTVW